MCVQRYDNKRHLTLDPFLSRPIIHSSQHPFLCYECDISLCLDIMAAKKYFRPVVYTMIKTVSYL